MMINGKELTTEQAWYLRTAREAKTARDAAGDHMPTVDALLTQFESGDFRSVQAGMVGAGSGAPSVAHAPRVEETDRIVKIGGRQYLMSNVDYNRPNGMANGMTHRQRDFIASLFRQLDTLGATQFRAEVTPKLASTTMREASALIDELKKNLEETRAAAAAAKPAAAPAHDPQVPAGRYALTGKDGATDFYIVKVTRRGFTIVLIQSSDFAYPVRDSAGVLDRIAEDPQGAMLRYGRELGQCGHCGRTLTDEASREAGIGPVCAQKTGW